MVGQAGEAAEPEEVRARGAELSHCEHDLVQTLLTSS